MNTQTLESLSHQLRVGDVLEITLIDNKHGEFIPGQIIEIAIGCKHRTKDSLFLHFCPYKIFLDIEPEEDGTTSFEVVVGGLTITDSERGILDFSYTEDDGADCQDVAWKKIASAH